VLRGGVGDIWHMYQKDTGKGRNVIVRTAHSVQSSPNLKSWQNTVKKAAITGLVTQAAREACVQYADKLPDTVKMRFYRDPNTKRCKMAALRPFMAFALIWVKDHRNEIATAKIDDLKSRKSEVVNYIMGKYGTSEAAITATAGGGKAAEVRGLWL